MIKNKTNKYRENEEELDEHSAEGHDSGKHCAGQQSQVPGLFGHLTWDLIGANWVRIRLKR